MSTQEFIVRIGELINYSIGLVIGIALLVFLWGLARFMFKTGDVKEVAAGKRLMTWGIVAIFVMVSVWGLVFFLQWSLWGSNADIFGKTNKPRSELPGCAPWPQPSVSGKPCI